MEYIKFELLEKKPKTSVYSVVNIKFGNILGIIKWYPAWRKYCFFSEGNTVYDVICLDNIRDFIQNLMDERMIVKRSKHICEHQFCKGDIREGEPYIIRDNKEWHLTCLDRFINLLQEDPTRPHEVEKIQKEYWENRTKMIKIR